MIYHFNQDNNDYFDGHNNSQDEQTAIVNMSHSSNNENKRKNLLSFSEKFQAIKESNRGILVTVFPPKSTPRFFCFLLIFITYLYLGAAIFGTIEIEQEKLDRSNFKEIRRQFLNINKCVSEKHIEHFIKEIEYLTNRGVSPRANASTNNYNWDFPNSVFFVTTLVTTIGYGNDKPVTIGGKIFCIFFVIFGVPLMMAMTSAVVERLYKLIDLLFSAMFYKLNWSITELKFRRIQIFVCFGILTVFFILIPGVIFSTTEESQWTYLDSLYYCIISLTTIGLGDFVPGSHPLTVERDLSKIFSTVYLFFGLLWVSFSIRVFHRYKNWNFMGNFIYVDSQQPQSPGTNTKAENQYIDDITDNKSIDTVDFRDDRELLSNNINLFSDSSVGTNFQRSSRRTVSFT